MAWFNLRHWFSSKQPLSLDEKLTSDEASPKKISHKRLPCYGILALLCILYGVVLSMLLIKNFKTTEAPESCDNLLDPMNRRNATKKLLLGRWILQEAYSSDPIDQYALVHAKSSWAKFSIQKNKTFTLDMVHRLYSPKHKTLYCVHHHFPNMKFRNNTLMLDLPKYNSNANFTFLHCCNECLIMIGKASVPNYEPLDYVLSFGLDQKLDSYYLQRSRKVASCFHFSEKPPFHYYGNDLCPERCDIGLHKGSNPLLDLFGMVPKRKHLQIS